MYTIEDFKLRDTQNQQSLTAALSFASYQYYVLNDPPMSDYEFDMEYKQLQALERESGIVLPNSPTQRVGSDIQGGFEKRKHIIPMQSIENVYTDDELQAWIRATHNTLKQAFPHDDISFTYEPKYDGLSISLVYTDGVLSDAVTRGNQIEGESVYENVKTIRNIPLELDRSVCPDLPAYFEVRGEVLMPESSFRRLNAAKIEAGERPFANKRNAASGSLKQLDPKITAQRGLAIEVFAAYSTDTSFQANRMSSQYETLCLLERLGFQHYRMEHAFTQIDALVDAINAFNEIRTSGTMPYDCDGVVVKVNERRHQEYMGLNTTFPNWCKARKFPQEAQSTLMRGVTFQVGMTGHITPVAELDPTAISGSIVSRATLNNESYIRTLGLKLGSYVFVQKAGEVIPQVSEVDDARNRAEEVELQDIVFPKMCPCCGNPLSKKGEYWVCTNHHCKEQVIQRLELWCSKDCANIKGLGPNIIADFVDKLHVSSVSDLYRIFTYAEQDFVLTDIFAPSYRGQLLQDLGEGYAEKSLAIIFDGVRKSVETLTLDQMINGFCIDGVGKITGRLLAEKFGTLDAFRSASFEQLVAIDGIGEVMASNILEFLGPDGHLDEYACLWNPRLPFNTTFQSAVQLGNALAGLTVIFTGTSYRFKRDEIKAFFTGHGAKYVGSVSGKVNYVVIGDAPGQNKVDKARELGVEVIDERAFYAKFGLE